MIVGHKDFGTLTDHVMYNFINLVCFNRCDDFYIFLILSVTVTDKLIVV